MNISCEMIDEAVTVPNKSYYINNLSTYKVTQMKFHHGWATLDMVPVVVVRQGNG
jgi:hypothetical protein